MQFVSFSGKLKKLYSCEIYLHKNAKKNTKINILQNDTNLICETRREKKMNDFDIQSSELRAQEFNDV